MIIELVMTVLLNVFTLLTTPINIPDLPAKVDTVLNTALEYITAGISIIGTYVDYGYLFILLSVVIAVDVGIMLYKLVMFILRKIPFLNVN